MDEDNNETFDKVNRRETLKSVGSAVGVSTFGVGTSVATSTTSRVTSVDFAEVAVVYETPSVPTTEQSVAAFATDYPPIYTVHEQKNELRLSELASENDIELLKSESSVYSSTGFDNFRSPVSHGPVHTLPSKITSDYRPVEELSLARPFQAPDVRLSSTANGVGVNTPNGDAHVATRETFEKRLSSSSAVVSVSESTGERARSPNNVENWRVGTKVRRSERALTIEPVVKVRNYGELEVVLP